MGRVFVFLIGLVVAGVGWAIWDPSVVSHLGPAAAYVPTPIPLGPLEAYRPIAAGAVAVLGALLLLGAIAGHRSSRARRSKSLRPQVLMFDSEDPAPAKPAIAPAAETPATPDPEAAVEPDPEPAPFPAAPLAVAGEPLPDAEPTPAFPAPIEEAEPAPARLQHGPEVELTDAPPAAEPAPEAEQEPTLAAEPVHAEPESDTASDDEAPFPSMPAPEEPESFEAARERLRGLAREENWSAAAAVLARLPKIAATDAEQALAAQDLGTFHRSQGKTDQAAEAFEAALSYARNVKPADPALLAATLTDVGDIAMEEHRLDAALACYSELVELRRGAIADDPGPETRRLLSLALERLGDAREDRGHRTRALELYRESLAIAGELAAADPARYGAELGVTRARVAELEKKLEL